MTWWKNNKHGGTHQAYKDEINARWEKFLGPSGKSTDEEILDFAHQIAEEYKEHYWKEQYYFELLHETATNVSPSQLGN